MAESLSSKVTYLVLLSNLAILIPLLFSISASVLDLLLSGLHKFGHSIGFLELWVGRINSKVMGILQCGKTTCPATWVRIPATVGPLVRTRVALV